MADEQIQWGFREIGDDQLQLQIQQDPKAKPKPPSIVLRNQTKPTNPQKLPPKPQKPQNPAPPQQVDKSSTTIVTNGSLWGSELNRSAFKKNKADDVVGMSVYMQYDPAIEEQFNSQAFQLEEDRRQEVKNSPKKNTIMEPVIQPAPVVAPTPSPKKPIPTTTPPSSSTSHPETSPKPKKPHPNKPAQPTITSYNIQMSNPSTPITLTITTTTTTITKPLTPKYITYLQKYFYHNFNTLLPACNPQALSPSQPQRSLAYLKTYLKYLITQHPALLIKFLNEQNFEGIVEPLQRPIDKVKDYVVGGFWQGVDRISQQIKKYKHGDSDCESDKVRAIERVFEMQVGLAEKIAKARKEIVEVVGVEVVPSVYEESKMQLKYEILAELQWVIGFQVTIGGSEKEVEGLLAEGHKVQGDKLKRMLDQFKAEKMKYVKETLSQVKKSIATLYQ